MPRQSVAGSNPRLMPLTGEEKMSSGRLNSWSAVVAVLHPACVTAAVKLRADEWVDGLG